MSILSSVSCSIVFPHQLFDNHPALDLSRPVFLIEEGLFFEDDHVACDFHIQKLVYHRLTIQRYQTTLEGKGFKVEIVGFKRGQSSIESHLSALHQRGYQEFHLCYPHDFLLEKRIRRVARTRGFEIQIHETPQFLTLNAEADAFFDQEKGYLMSKFYIFQRRRLGILVDDEGNPVDGRWSFDEENRKKLPKKIEIPSVKRWSLSEGEKVVAEEMSREFPNAVGRLSDSRLPLTTEEAHEMLDQFLNERLMHFGEYEDAISSKHSTIFHSYLTPALNIGLITAREIVDKTLLFAQRHQIPMNSLEGFIRQIIGWREFIHQIYRREGVAMRNLNFFNHHRPIPKSFYEGTTGIPLVDRTINRIHENAYCHHIERLMVLGNIMLLCEFEPNAVYRYFMEFFLDSYDWVMITNVYGMSQFADGGFFATKPYFSSSNYLLKMSDEPKGEWQKIWDGLFWRFIHRNRDYFKGNFRTMMMVSQLGKMSSEKLQEHIENSEKFLNNDCRVVTVRSS